jgi:hypothetical protein
VKREQKRQAAQYKCERRGVCSAPIQEVVKNILSTHTRAEKVDFFLQRHCSLVMAEITAVERVLENSHRVPRGVGKHRKYRGTHDDRAHEVVSTEAGKWFTFGTALSAYSGKPVNVTTRQ